MKSTYKPNILLSWLFTISSVIAYITSAVYIIRLAISLPISIYVISPFTVVVFSAVVLPLIIAAISYVSLRHITSLQIRLFYTVLFTHVALAVYGIFAAAITIFGSLLVGAGYQLAMILAVVVTLIFTAFYPKLLQRYATKDGVTIIGIQWLLIIGAISFIAQIIPALYAIYLQLPYNSNLSGFQHILYWYVPAIAVTALAFLLSRNRGIQRYFSAALYGYVSLLVTAAFSSIPIFTVADQQRIALQLATTLVSVVLPLTVSTFERKSAIK